MINAFKNFFVIKFFKLFGHPVKLFSENSFNKKFRFKVLIKLKYILMKNQKKISNRFFFKDYSKLILDFIFLPFYKNEIRKKRFEISIEETRYLSLRLTKYLSFFFLENNENNLIFQHKLIYTRLKKRIVINENDIASSSCFFKNNKNICFGFSSGVTKIFNMHKRRYILEIKSSKKRISLLHSHPHINSLFFLSDNSLSRIVSFFYDLNKIQVLSLFHNEKIMSSSFRSHGKIIDLSDFQNILKSFDFEYQKWITNYKFLNSIFCLANNNSGSLLSLGKKKEIGIFDLRINKQVLTLLSQNNPIMCTQWSYDENFILSSGTNGNVSIWDLRHLKKKKELKCHKKSIKFFKLNSDLIVSSSFSKNVLISNYKTNKIIRRIMTYDQKIATVNFSWKSSVICTANLNKKITISYL